jgi:uncharacterized protein (TIGR03086 family)
MREHELIARAAPPTLAVIRAVRPDQLTAPTPCTEYDVQELIGHLQHWAPALARASRHCDGAAPPEVEARIDELVAAWSVPTAWEGMTTMGGPHEMPARMIGAMAVGEVVVHGWDLARATGRPISWDETLLDFLYDEVAKTAELGREMQAYGAEIPVPRTAPVLDRMLGLTGRDPHWTP